VAIKTISLLSQSPEEDREFRDRLFIEARAAGRLSHPGIVTVFDVGEDLDTLNPYIVMEYVAGASLEGSVAQRADKFPLSITLAMIEQVAEALDYAHSQGIVHRDIKPANILLPENGCPKITDFGIAKFNFGHNGPLSEALGTPAYMSPEQLNGEPVDGRSDLFSLGVVLYTLLTGYRPFQGNSALTVSFKVVHRNPLPATAFDSAFPPEIDALVQRCMAKDPGERFQTGRDMASALKELRELAQRGGESRESSFDSIYSTPSTQLIQGTPLASTQITKNISITKSNPNWPAWQYAAAAVLTVAVFAFAFLIFREATGAHPHALPEVTSRDAGAGTTAQPPRTANDRKSQPLPLSSSITSHASQPSKDVHAAAPVPVRARTAERPTSTLRLRVEHRFQQAEVVVWIDDKLAYDQIVGGIVKKRMVVFKNVEGYQSDSLHIPAGEHRFRIRVHSADDSYDQTATISGVLPKDGERQLLVECEKKSHLRLTLL
jgi:serine/threonine-protein kinase